MSLSNGRIRPLSLVLVMLSGCGAGGDAAPAPAPKPTPIPAAPIADAPTADAPIADAPTAAVADAPTAAIIAQADVQQLVDEWLAAQNSGDLGSYLGLYAARFEGVKRSGERVVRMHREGWVADRTKMFVKKMTVTADNVSITTTPTTAQVTLTQTWAAGTYKDVGPKLLVVVKEAGALRIAREEMLASTLEDVKRLPFHTPEQFAFVIQDGGTRIVLDVAPQTSWAVGAAQLLADTDPFTTRKAVDAAKLPATLAAWTGKKVRLYGPAGPVCEATLGSLALVGRVIPHFGEVARWHGTADDGARPLSKPQIASSAWDLAAAAPRSGIVLAADISYPQGDCKTALWAQLASEPERKVAAAEAAPPELARRLLAALRKLPEYKRIQATSETPAPWDLQGKTGTVVMSHPSGKQVAFISTATDEGCGDFQASLSAAFELNGDKHTLAGKPMEAPLQLPGGLIDTGDGKLEILFSEQLLRGATGYDQIDALVIPFLDCGC